MNRVVINLEALRDNLQAVDGWLRQYGAAWTVATKALSGHGETLRALIAMGVRSVTDSRLDNLRAMGELSSELERWYLRPPHPSAAAEVVAHSDVSLNTELATLEALSREARAQDRLHSVFPMVELGDLREGIPPAELLDFCSRANALPGLRLAGLGAQLGCVSGLGPTPDHVAQLQLYLELVERKLGIKLPLISAGSTMFLPMLLDGVLPPGVSHWRIGEALYLGSNLVSGGLLPGLNNDVIRLEAEVVEIKKKSLIPLGQVVEGTPFAPLAPEHGEGEAVRASAAMQRGYRALIAIGQLDTEVSGLEPVDTRQQIAGASSDITVLNIGQDHNGLEVGDTVRFKASYSAFVRLLSARYLPKEVQPPLEDFLRKLPDGGIASVPPVLPTEAG